MATTGPKTFHFHRSHRVKLILRLLGAVGVLLLLIAGTVFAVKMQKKVKRLFHEIEALQSSEAQSEYRLSQEIERLKSAVKAKGQNEEAIFVQLAELKAAQSASRRDIDRLTLVNKGYEVSLQEISDRYARLKETNEELTLKVRSMEQRGSQTMSEMKAELIRKVDSANLREEVVKIAEEVLQEKLQKEPRKVDPAQFREEVVKIVEEVLQEKLQKEFNKMFQERKEISQRLEELEGKVGFMKALDAQSALTNPFPEVVEKISNEKHETNDNRPQDPFYISDASDGDASTSSEDETMKKRQEAIDLRVAELIELFNRKDGENDVLQGNQKTNNVKVEEDKAKLLDPFYIEEIDVPVKPKVEVKKEEVPKIPEVPNPNDPFYIEDADYVFVASESKASSNWRQEYAEKAKDLLEKTKNGIHAAENYVKEQIPTASKKMKEIGKEIGEKAHQLNTEIKHQAEKLAEKAKKVSKTIMSLFNR